MAVEHALQVGLAPGAHGLLHDLAALEDEQGGDGLHVVLDGQLLVLVDVDLSYGRLAVVLIGELINHWPDHFAGAAPFSPEINQYGSWGL